MSKFKLFFESFDYIYRNGSYEALVKLIAHEFKKQFDKGSAHKSKQIIKLLTDYLELTKFSEDVEGAEPNPEWDSGFNAAIALIKGETK